MKLEQMSLSDDDSEDSRAEDRTSYHALRGCEWERCEICDKLFKNRYNMLKHRVNHIIIPLERLTTHECMECLHHFTSIEDLARHTANKHEETPSPSVINGILPEILQSIVERQVIIKCEDDLNELYSKSNELFNLNVTKQYENGLTVNCDYSDSIKEEPVSPKIEHSSGNDKPSSPNEEEIASIRQRLLFEEDFEDNLFSNLIYKQMMPGSDNLALEPANLGPIAIQNRRDLLPETYNTTTPVQEHTTDLIKYGAAIHYDVLMEPEVCLCRWCGKDFPNRFKLLEHEPVHISMKSKRKWAWPLCYLCERYISGNYHTLRKHMEKNHPNAVETNFDQKKCPKCNLKYHDFSKHLLHYHEAYKCSECQEGFETSHLRDVHICGAKNCKYTSYTIPSESKKITPTNMFKSMDMNKDLSSREPCDTGNSFDVKTTACEPYASCMMKLCELCFSFMKIYIQNRQNYEIVGKFSEMGVRQTCYKCNGKFFDVILVKRKIILKDIPKKIKPQSNAERLKKIQCRLKMMRKRNRC